MTIIERLEKEIEKLHLENKVLRNENEKLIEVKSGWADKQQSLFDDIDSLKMKNKELIDFSRSAMDILNRMSKYNLPLSTFDVKVHKLQIQSVSLINGH